MSRLKMLTQVLQKAKHISLQGVHASHTGIFAQNSFHIDYQFMLHFNKVAILTENCQNYLFFNTKTNKGEIGLYFGNNEKNCQVAPQVRNLKKKYKNPDISTIIPPLGMTWVSKEAVWSTLGYLIDFGRCFPAKIEQTLRIF